MHEKPSELIPSIGRDGKKGTIISVSRIHVCFVRLRVVKPTCRDDGRHPTPTSPYSNYVAFEMPPWVSISTEENIYRSPAPNPDAILDYVPEMNTIAATNTDSVQEANDPTRDPVSCLVCRNGVRCSGTVAVLLQA